MTRQEVAAVLAMIASLDGRRAFGEVDVIAWEAVVGDLRFADAREAVILHYRESTQTLMPASLYATVKRIRRERIGRSTPELPCWLDPENIVGAISYKREWYALVGDGMSPEAATAAVEQRRAPRQIVGQPARPNAPSDT